MTSMPTAFTTVTGASSLSVIRDQEGPSLLCLRAVLEDTVAGVFDVDAEDLRTPTRGIANVSLARQVAMYIAHVDCGLSLTDVGRLFERDRTTVSHGCSVVELKREEPSFDEAIRLLELVIRVLYGLPSSSPARC
jgi:chromosomal replication initiation ATPase DnaA